MKYLPYIHAVHMNLLQYQYRMPIHWGSFSLAMHDWDEPVRRSIPLAIERGLPVLTPLIGQVFDADTKTGLWWEEV